MASATDIARAQIMLGNTGQWSDVIVGATIDNEGGVPEACVLLLESAATAAAFQPDVAAGSQKVTQAHVAGELRKAAQRIRDEYVLPGAVGSISTLDIGTGRAILGGGYTDCFDTIDDPTCW